MKRSIYLCLILSLLTQTVFADGATDSTSTATDSTSTSTTDTGNSLDFSTIHTPSDSSNFNEDQKGKLQYPIENLLKSTQWDLFLSEFEMKMQVGYCKGANLDSAVGFKAHMIEPIGYMEMAKKPLFFPFAGIDLGTPASMMKTSVGRNHSEDEAARDSFIWNHFIYVPIMGMIFKKKLKFVCFNQGNIAFPMLSEFNLVYQKDIYFMKMIPHMLAMFNPQTLISTILDCGATEGTNIIKGFSSKTSGGGFSEEKIDSIESQTESPTLDDEIKSPQDSFKDKGMDALNFIRNSMYYNVGCLGFSPVGGYVEGGDPGTDIILLAHENIALMQGASAFMPNPLLFKQSNFGMDTTTSDNSNPINMVNTMCRPEKFPLPIKTQYVFQRTYPTVGRAVEFGSGGMTTTVAANHPLAQDQFVYLVWERRDYYAFAYFCPESGM